MLRIHSILLLCLLFLPHTAGALSLEEGLRAVTESGRDVKIAQAGVAASEKTVSLAQSSRLPWVDAYGRETWLRYQPEAKTPFGAMPTAQDKFYTYGVKATQLLYDFGKSSSSVEAAQFGLKASRLETDRAKSQAALEFVMAYLDLLESEKLLQVAREELRQYEAHKKDAETRFHAGVITRNEVLQADVVLSDSQQRLVTAENRRSLAASRVNSQLQKPLNDEVVPEEIKASPAAGLTLEDAWASAEASRAVLREMDAMINAKDRGISTARAEYMPSFYLSGGYEYTENQYMVHPDNWSVIAGVNINLSSGGASDSRVGIARAEHRSLKLTREKMLDAVRLEVKSAYLDLESSRKRMDVTRTAVASAEENLRLLRLRYQEGVATSTEVLDAVTLLTTAGSNSWKSLYGYKRAEAALLNAAGKDLASVYGK